MPINIIRGETMTYLYDVNGFKVEISGPVMTIWSAFNQLRAEFPTSDISLIKSYKNNTCISGIVIAGMVNNVENQCKDSGHGKNDLII